MTRKEIIDGLEIYTVGRLNKDKIHITVEELQKFIDEIKTLKQEPCEDCISRERTMLRVREFIGNSTYTEKMLVDDLNALPSVTPQPKIGRWIEEKNDYGEITNWHCSNCYEDSGFITTCRWDYCPNCGRKMMQEVEE